MVQGGALGLRLCHPLADHLYRWKTVTGGRGKFADAHVDGGVHPRAISANHHMGMMLVHSFLSECGEMQPTTPNSAGYACIHGVPV